VPTKPETKVNASHKNLPVRSILGLAVHLHQVRRAIHQRECRLRLKDHQSKPRKALRAIALLRHCTVSEKPRRSKPIAQQSCSNRGKPGTLSLRGVLSRYFQYHNRARTHLSLDKDCPQPRRISFPVQARSSRSLRWAACIIATNVARHDLRGPPTDPPASA
jgi:hypothetical protein